MNWWSTTPNSSSRFRSEIGEGLNSMQLSAHPNPFINEVKVPVGDQHFVLEIYNMSGGLIRKFSGQPQTTGVLVWDGTNDNGTPVTPGVYQYRLTAHGLTTTGKLIKKQYKSWGTSFVTLY